MDEPTLAEEVRRLADRVRQLLEAQANYVTKEILDLKLSALVRDHEDLAKDVAAGQEKLSAMHRWAWSGVAAPVIVGVILYLILGKSP